MRTFLIELQSRPDGIINSSINSYSTEAMTMAMFYQRCAAAITSTQFTKVYLMVIDEDGNMKDQRLIETQYVAPEPESESDPDSESTPEE